MAVPTAEPVFNDLNFRLALPELEFIVNDSGATRAARRRAPLGDRRIALLATLRLRSSQLVWMDDGPAPDGSPTWDELAAARPSPRPPTSTPIASPASPTPAAPPGCRRA